MKQRVFEASKGAKAVMSLLFILLFLLSRNDELLYCQEIDVLLTNVSVLLINDVLLIANLLIDVLLINVVYGGGDVWMKSGKFSHVL